MLKKGKLIPKGFISKCRLNTLKSTKLENRFMSIKMTEQHKYLHGKLSILENKEKDIFNRIHADLFKKQFQVEASSVQSIDPNDIATDIVGWKNQAYLSRIKAQA